MLRLTVELWPGGNRNKKVELGYLNIANLSELAATSDYEFTATDTQNNETVIDEVKGFERKKGWARLLTRVFKRLADKHPHFARDRRLE